MISKIATSAVALAAIGFASSASAWHFSPESHALTGTGATAATLGTVTLPCTATIHGSTNASGVGTVTGGGFKSTTVPQCALVHLKSLPWVMTATGATTATVAGVVFSTPVGSCGPATLNLTVTPVSKFHSTLAFNQPLHGCLVQGTLTMTPALNIVAN